MPARWSLIPHWHKGALKDWKASTFNARIEEAAQKPSFRAVWRERHCLVPVAGFYEWTGEKKARQKHVITRADNFPMIFAGLWDEVIIQGQAVLSFTILTKASGEQMAQIHVREPVILEPVQWQDWLSLRPCELSKTPPLNIESVFIRNYNFPKLPL